MCIYIRNKFKKDIINIKIIYWGGNELNVEIYIELENVVLGDFEN